jgi:hypothetical protein
VQVFHCRGFGWSDPLEPISFAARPSFDSIVGRKPGSNRVLEVSTLAAVRVGPRGHVW